MVRLIDEKSSILWKGIEEIKEKEKNETLELIAELHEQNRQDNREFQSRLLSVLETFLSSISN